MSLYGSWPYTFACSILISGFCFLALQPSQSTPEPLFQLPVYCGHRKGNRVLAQISEPHLYAFWFYGLQALFSTEHVCWTCQCLRYHPAVMAWCKYWPSHQKTTKWFQYGIAIETLLVRTQGNLFCIWIKVIQYKHLQCILKLQSLITFSSWRYRT